MWDSWQTDSYLFTNLEKRVQLLAGRTRGNNHDDPTHKKHPHHSTTHLKTLFAGGASLHFGIARGKLAANFLFREDFAPFFARGSSMGHISVMQVRFTGPQGRGPLVRRQSAIIGVDKILFTL